MDEEKKYVVPDEIALLFNKREAAIKLRNFYTKMPFGYKRALRAAIDHEKFTMIFWKAVRQLYPELNGETIEYQPHEQIIQKVKPKD
ncbi:MAG: hypothetical protein ABIK28_08990 [Planctomycetota bacterium]